MIFIISWDFSRFDDQAVLSRNIGFALLEAPKKRWQSFTKASNSSRTNPGVWNCPSQRFQDARALAT